MRYRADYEQQRVYADGVLIDGDDGPDAIRELLRRANAYDALVAALDAADKLIHDNTHSHQKRDAYLLARRDANAALAEGGEA